MNIQIELISEYDLADASFNIVMMFYGDQQGLLYQIRMVLLIFHKLHLVLALMKAFQQWDYFLMPSP